MNKTTKCFECDGSGWDKEMLSYCCGVSIPDYPDNGLCPKCNEHTEPDQCEKCAGTGELDLSEHPHDLIEKGRKYDELKASHERVVKALEAAAFDLRIRKQMKENLTPMQLSILEKAEQSLENHVK